MHLPHGRTILQNAPLQFVNLDSVLNAGKVERGHQISGFLEMVYPDGVDLLFLKRGEPMNAVRIEERPFPASIADVVSRARGSIQGIISLYEASPEIVTMAITAFSQPPVLEESLRERADLRRVLDRLAVEEFKGFVALERKEEISFLLFDGGRLRKGYFASHTPPALEEMLDGEHPYELHLRGFRLEELPAEQASPAHIAFLLRVLNGVVGQMRALVGPELVQRTVASSHRLAVANHPALADFSWDDDGNAAGDSMAAPEVLNAGFADWIDSFAESFRVLLGERVDTLVSDSLRDYRFALRAAGFDRRPRWEKRLS
jgi:hypothetical protein